METSRNYFFWYRPLYEKALERRICLKCPKWRGEHGICDTPDPDGCAVFRYLPELVMTAQRLKSPTLPEFAQAVYRNVPMKCHNPSPDEFCGLKDTLECDLKGYLPMVLEAVKEVDEYLEVRNQP
ncbi:MAG: hypothetical protein ACREH5_05235 [Candidatus Omnitrophota bacterium]